MSTLFTKEQVQKTLPSKLRSSVTDEIVDELNDVSDPIACEAMRENFVSYTSVLDEGRYKTSSYLSAVKYVTFKLMNYTNQESYIRTFPDRYQKLIANGTSQRDIAAYASMYNKGKLVNAILKQTLVPTWVLNQDIYQKAINAQAELMMHGKSEMARTQAANSILTHLKKPEAAGPLINMDMRETSGMDELKGLLGELASKQMNAWKDGLTAKEIAEQPIKEVTPEEDSE